MDFILALFAVLILLSVRLQKSETDYLSSKNMLPVRGIMAMAIVLHHMSERTSSGMFFPFMQHMGYLIVAVFFFLSGYGLLMSYIRNGEKYLKGYWKNRILYFLIVFLLADIIYSIYHLFTGDFKPSIIIAANSWYMVVQLLLYVIFWCVFKAAGNKINTGIILNGVLEIVLAIALAAIGKPGIWYISNFAFLFGLITAKNKHFVDSMLNQHYWFCAICAVVIFGLFSALPSLFSVKGIFYILCRMISTVFFCSLIIVICRKIKIDSKIWNWLGTISLEIYLYHGLVYMILRNFIKDDVLWTATTVIISVPVAWFMHKGDSSLKKVLKR